VQPSRFAELIPSCLEEGIDRTKQRQLQIVICDATGTKKEVPIGYCCNRI